MKKIRSLLYLLLVSIFVLQIGFLSSTAVETNRCFSEIIFSEPIKLKDFVDNVFSKRDKIDLLEVRYQYKNEEGRMSSGGIGIPEFKSKANMMNYINKLYLSLLENVEKSLGKCTTSDNRRSKFYSEGLYLKSVVIKADKNKGRTLAKDLNAQIKIFSNLSSESIKKQTRSIDSESYDVKTASDYAPTSGVVNFYTNSNGWRCIYNEMNWSTNQVFNFNSGDGYEHEVVFYNYDDLCWVDGLRGSSSYGWESDLPDAYLDTATVCDDTDEPVYTVGTFDATKIFANTDYYSLILAYPGNSNIDSAKLLGQRTSVSLHSIWFVTVQETKFLVGSWGLDVPGSGDQDWVYQP